MANHRGGGLVIVGVSEDAGKKLTATGLTDEELATWDYDTLCDQVGKYADPSVSLEIEVVPANGKNCLVIKVNEFGDMPIICKKERIFDPDASRGRPGRVTVLLRGAIYSRSLRKPESKPIEATEDMRELIRLATEKEVVRYRALRALEDDEKSPAVPRPEKLYDDELKDFQ
jgi:predicted HTH transcriptional regulator